MQAERLTTLEKTPPDASRGSGGGRRRAFIRPPRNIPPRWSEPSAECRNLLISSDSSDMPGIYLNTGTHTPACKWACHCMQEVALLDAGRGHPACRDRVHWMQVIGEPHAGLTGPACRKVAYRMQGDMPLHRIELGPHAGSAPTGARGGVHRMMEGVALHQGVVRNGGRGIGPLSQETPAAGRWSMRAESTWAAGDTLPPPGVVTNHIHRRHQTDE